MNALVKRQNALAQVDRYGQHRIGGEPTFREYLEMLMQPETRATVANVLADTAPVSAQARSIDRLGEQYQAYQNAQNPIQKVLRAADMGLEGGALAADVFPIAKAGAAALGPLAAMMAKRSDPLANILRRQAGIIGYHGSPHKFTKFNHSKMGSGEGAQAYGWGTYIAENPEVATDYQRRLSDTAGEIEYQYRGKTYQRGTPEWKALGTIFNDGKQSAKILKNAYRGDLRAGSPYISEMGGEEFVKRFESVLDAKKSDIKQLQGNLYEVDLPDEHIAKMLDWDAPLSEQPEVWSKIKDSLPEFAPTKLMSGKYGVTRIGSDGSGRNIVGLEADTPDQAMKMLTGERIHDALYQKFAKAGAPDPKRMAAVEMLERGIPGIKYFDGNSRTAGKGTRNFVVFDEDLMTILKRNDEKI